MSRAVGNDVRLLLTSVARPKSLGASTQRICRVDERFSLLQQSSIGATRSCRSKELKNTYFHRGRRWISGITGKNDNSAAETDDDGKAPRPPLAIVFTDIVKSTEIWEQAPEAMDEAMGIHDDLLRNLSDKYEGYEVKQNGDGFMFAFQSAPTALNFCLELQVQLQAQDWPEELLSLKPAEAVIKQVDHASEQEVVLWKGLRLRMSAHYGEPVCKWNGITKRMDYLGPAVNRAARFVGVCEGGQIVVSQEFLCELKQARKDVAGHDDPIFNGAQDAASQKAELDVNDLHDGDMSASMKDTRFELRFLGEREFKGVSEKQKLYYIMPKSLAGRIDYLPKHNFVQPNKGNLIDGM